MSKLFNDIRRFWLDDSGQTASEYMLILSILSIGMYAAARLLGWDGPIPEAVNQLSENYAEDLTTGESQ